MVSWGPARLDLVVIGADKGLYHKSWDDNASWSPSASEFLRLGFHTYAEQPATISRGPDSIDVFALGTDSKVYRHSYEKGKWKDGQVLDGVWQHKPAAFSLSQDQYHLFLVGVDGTVCHKRYDAQSHSAVKDCGSLAASVRAGVTVASWGANHMDVYCLNFNGSNFYTSWNGNEFSPRVGHLPSLGDQSADPVTAVSAEPGRLDLFTRGVKTLYHKYLGSSRWLPSKGWEKLEGEIVSRPHAVSREPKCLDVFSIDPHRSLIHKRFDGSAWHDWEKVGNQCWDIDSVISKEEGRLDVFYRGVDNAVHHRWLKGKDWFPADLNGDSLGQPVDANLAANIPITGVVDPNPSSESVIPLRRDISILQSQYKEQFDLFIRAFRNLQLKPETSSTSFYGIGTIHGVPYIRWPFEESARPGDNEAGYCCHRSVLFPVWHRVYMLLLEQAIQQEAVEIAKEFTGPFKDVYADAAAKLRFPFWDWTKDGGALPRAAMYEEIAVAHGGPNGVVDFKRIPNPLAKYTFRDPEMHKRHFKDGPSFDPKNPMQVWSNYLQTMRCPNEKGETQNDVVDTQLLKQNRNVRDMVYKLMTVTDYQPFASTGYEPGAGNVNNTQSLEGIHDGIHVLVGIDPTPLDGHMGDTMYAGFDPIFYLHHCNVDRIFALWSCCNPGVVVEAQNSKDDIIFYKGGTRQDDSTPLYPYRHSDGKYFTSKDVDGWDATKRWGYRYPEMPEDLLKSGDAKGMKKYATKQVIELFGPTDVNFPNVPKDAVQTANRMNELANQCERGANYIKEAFQIIFGHFPIFDLKARHRREWLVNLKIENFAIRGSFNVHFFLGDFNPNPLIWTQDGNLVGTHSVFSNNVDLSDCKKCIEDANSSAIVSGGVSLTIKLLEKGLSDLEPESVIPYLQKNLHWRIQTADGTYIQSANIPSLAVSVSCTIVELPDEPGELPLWGVPQIFTDVTKDKAGGAQEGTKI